jgi:hypothetical protein
MEAKTEARKLAAERASERYNRATDRHRAAYKMDMTLIEKSEAAMEAKVAAEQEYGIKITVTLDVQEMFWFQ